MNFAIDMDGVLARWDWSLPMEQGAGEWMDGARDGVAALREHGHKVVVHTCRATWEAGGGMKAVADFLRDGRFVPFAVVGMAESEEWRAVTPEGWVEPVPTYVATSERSSVGIWFGRGKPIAHFYVDDRSVPPFDNDWAALLAMATR